MDLGLGKIAYGGDWNPEQWEREVWLEDLRLFEEAGIDLLTINVFGWTLLQPEEDRYDFTHLDEVIGLLRDRGMKACLGTGTAAHPAWMATRYPDILRVDFQGRKRKYGDRHNSCPSSPTYRAFAPRLAGALAQRYKDEPTVALWHVCNEYTGACYCENCERAFRAWLQKRYGSLEALNAAWNTRFWSQTVTDWDQIVAPNQLSVQWSERGMSMQGIVLDYQRFNSDNLLECFELEAQAIRRHIPQAIVTTNLMGAYRGLDYRAWARRMDVVSWDCYPLPSDPPARTAMLHDLMRGLKDGEPFLLMEQTPSQTNWHPYSSLKRPGVMRLGSYQALAHGADTVMFFQMRRSRGGCEKYHGAVIDHSGRSDTRVFREVTQLGAELKKIGAATLGSRLISAVALWFDWECWWASENSSGPSVALEYLEEVGRYYAAFHGAGVSVDLVGPDTDLEGYKILLAPLLYLLHPQTPARLTAFVEGGGTLLTTFLSGVADPSDLVFRGGPPGPLKPLLGVWVEETDALPPQQTNRIVMGRALGPLAGSYACNLVFDVLRVEEAEVLATYGQDFYQGRPVLTRKRTGNGSAWYVASSPEPRFLSDFVAYLCQEAGVEPVLPGLPRGVEATRRHGDGRSFLFVLNHTEGEATLNLGERRLRDLISGAVHAGTLVLPPRGVVVGEEMG
jgi:beta-galactosidase